MSDADQDVPVIKVAGGVYQECCTRPASREIYGSAGRAASAIASMGGHVELHAYLDINAQEVMTQRSSFEAFSVNTTAVEDCINFDYYHGLSTPRISNHSQRYDPLSVDGGHIVRFGMLEGTACVHGDKVVYDPQNATCPEAFAANGSTANQLALVLNLHEAELLTGMINEPVERVANTLIGQDLAEVVVIKMGPLGALVHDGASRDWIPAFRSNSVWKIGSGDNFVAHFAFRWMHEGHSAKDSAILASKATAYYCESRGFATPDILSAYNPAQVSVSTRFKNGRQPCVYLAGPFFTLSELWMIEQAKRDLASMGLNVFSPYHDIGYGAASDVVPEDLAGIDKCDLMFAIGDGMDPGTVFETGYACAQGKPVIVYCENESDERKKMMEGSHCTLRDDYVTAIYETLWAACAL